MSWTDTLKDLISVNLPKLKSLISVTVNINCNNQINKYEFDENQKILSIDLGSLSTEEKRKLGETLLLAREEGQILLENKSAELVQDFKLKDASTEVQAELDFLKKIVPPEDFNIWRAAFYIRARFLERKEIQHLKDDIIKKYGPRGKNITNLCTAGYIDRLLKPNYQYLKEQLGEEEDLKKQFQKLYQLVVYELTVTVFVSSVTKKQEVKAEVLSKIKQNSKYGIKFLNIHGIGQDNLEKINEVVGEIQKDPAMRPEISGVSVQQEKNIAFLRLEF